MTSILFIGDIVGRPGRHCVRDRLPLVLEQYPSDLVIANAENSAGGFGLSAKIAHELFEYGVDALTLGNHAFDNKDVMGILDDPRVVRPMNFRQDAPGKGCSVVKARNGASVAVINLIGRVFMQQYDCPFDAIDTLLEHSDLPVIRFVDMHAEASSEKQAMAHYVDGRVSAVIGTHTHVPTSDERNSQGWYRPSRRRWYDRAV